MNTFRNISLLLFISAIVACSNAKPNDRSQTQIDSLQKQIDSLQQQISSAYKPGLGEFMSSIQVHHNKLWFAGKNRNWALADFEIKEIGEAIDDIRNFCTDRPEVKMIGMIDVPIDSLNFSIEKKDTAMFRRSFITLTNTCNGCHQNNNFGFNVVKIPDQPPFSNQEFK